MREREMRERERERERDREREGILFLYWASSFFSFVGSLKFKVTGQQRNSGLQLVWIRKRERERERGVTSTFVMKRRHYRKS
jgi:hypothetical protein